MIISGCNELADRRFMHNFLIGLRLLRLVIILLEGAGTSFMQVQIRLESICQAGRGINRLVLQGQTPKNAEALRSEVLPCFLRAVRRLW